jgi:penicillin amidase
VDLLGATQLLSVNDFAAIQADVYAIPAARLVPAYRNAGAKAGGDAATAARLLAGWDGRMTASSVAASVYEAITGELVRELIEPLLGKQLYTIYHDNYSTSGLYSVLLGQIANPGAPFFSAGTPAAVASARDGLIATAMAAAFAQLRERFGADTTRWTWGALHQAHFDHPLASVQPLDRVFGLSPVARAGGGVTVNIGGDGHFSSDPVSYDQRSVPSMREIIDLGDFDRSLWVITTGESGQPFSPHYSDLVALWASGTYQQMAYSAAAETKAATDYLQLKPAG